MLAVVQRRLLCCGACGKALSVRAVRQAPATEDLPWACAAAADAAERTDDASMRPILHCRRSIAVVMMHC